jgi:6-phosphogluconolactonase
MNGRSTALLALSLVLAAGTALGTEAAPPAAGAAGPLVYIGTRGNNASPAPGSAVEQPEAVQGIYAARLDEQTGRLSLIGQVIPLNRAQWLAVHPTLPVIYAVATSSRGTGTDSDIYSFAIDRATGSVRLLTKVGAGGPDATHLAVDAASGTLFSANHGSDTDSPPPLRAGTVSALPLRADGSLTAAVSIREEFGSGPNPRRQRNAQSHCVLIDPSRHHVLVADLGADRIFIYRFDSTTRDLKLLRSEPLPPGSGPRHMVFHPNGRYLYVNTELTAELHVFRWDAKHARLHSLQSLSGYPAGYRSDVEKSSAELAISRDGRFVYLALRGDQDSIVSYAVDPGTGKLKEQQRISTGGKNPRSFGIDPAGHWLLATNDSSNSVTVLAIDSATGLLSATGESMTVPNPATVAFYGK